MRSSANLGYTLVELVVVMVIMAMSVGLAFPMFKTYSNKRTLRSAGQNLKQEIDQARISANSTPQEATLPNNPAYQVALKVASDSVPPAKIATCLAEYDSATYKSFDDCAAEHVFELPSSINVKDVLWSYNNMWGNTREDVCINFVDWWQPGYGSNPSDPNCPLPSTTEFAMQFSPTDKDILFIRNADVTQKYLYTNSYNLITIRLQNINNGNTQDFVMDIMTGFSYLR